MISFVSFLIVLLIASLFCDDKSGFAKSKMLPMKAILAFLIVADHLTFLVDISWIQPIRKWGAPIVSLFFFISGYGLHKSFIYKGQEYLNHFFRKRIFKVFLPSVIALFFYYAVNWDSERQYLEELYNLFKYGYTPLPHSWFVFVIISLYCIFYISYKFITRWQVPALFVGSSLLSIAAFIVGYDRCWYVCTLAFPTGALFAQLESYLLPRVLKSNIKYLLVWGLLLLCVGFFYVVGGELAYSLCYVFIPLSVAIIISRLPVQKLHSSFVTFVGGLSYEIYLCQGIGMTFFRNVVNIHSDYLYIVLVYVTTLLFAFLVSNIASLIFKTIEK